MKALFVMGALALALYGAVAAFMYVEQRRFQYFPQASVAAGYEPVSAYAMAGFEDVTITTSDGETLKAWYGPPPEPDDPVIVYLHGNAGTLGDRHERFELFRNEGFGVLALSWRGFGGSTGSPTEKGLIEDGKAALAFLQGKGVPISRIVIFGESLGTGVAVQLAANPATSPRALILEAPYISAADVARRQYWFLPVGLLMKDQYQSIDFAAGVSAPVFIFHGTADYIIPIDQGKRLFEAFSEPKQFYTMQGAGHIDPLTPASWGAIKAFMTRRITG